MNDRMTFHQTVLGTVFAVSFRDKSLNNLNVLANASDIRDSLSGIPWFRRMESDLS